ncbi:MAG: TonB-dependent receptor [Bacteroidota bacterium]
MQKILSIILLSIISLQISAQDNDAVIVGQVISDGEHLPFVNVIVKGTNIGTTTDVSGHYTLSNVPVGSVTVRAQSVGYKADEQTVEIEPDQTKEIKFQLKEDNIGLEQVVVTADRNEVDRSETPVIINVINTKLIESTGAVCAADGLNFQPGLRVENNCQNCGFTQLRMNGLDGNYSQILINSRPIFSALSGVYGLEHIPTTMIDRLEIVRGGGSALFGANAIAGTVNIITRDPLFNSYQLSGNYSLIDNQSSDYLLNFNSSVVTEDRNSGIFLFGMYRNRQPYDANNDSFSEITKLKNLSGGFSAFYKPGHYSKISIDLHALNEFRRGGNKFDELPHITDITEQVIHNILGGGINYDITSKDYQKKLSVFVSGQYTDRDSYYGAEYNPAGYGNTKDLSGVAGFQYAQSFSQMLFAPGKLTTGFEDTYSDLLDEKLGYLDYQNNEYVERRTIVAQKLNNIGTFLQAEWSFNKIKFLLGVRYDVPDKALGVKPVFIPRGNILINLSQDVQMRWSYAKGYRSPQVFDEDLHIEASAARMHVHSISDNLKPETSHSVSGSLDYTLTKDNFQAYFLVEGFYTQLLDPFSKEFVFHEDDKQLEVIKVNAEEGAFVAGVNIEGKIAFSKNIQLQMGGTIQRAEYEIAQQWGEDEANTATEIMKSPKQYGYLVFTYSPFKQFSTSLSGNYTGSMLVPHLAGGYDANGNIIMEEELVTSDAFFDTGIKLSYNFKLSNEAWLQLNGGVQNIFNSYQNDFDQGKYRDAGYIYGPSKPRTIFFGIKLSNFL